MTMMNQELNDLRTIPTATLRIWLAVDLQARNLTRSRYAEIKAELMKRRTN